MLKLLHKNTSNDVNVHFTQSSRLGWKAVVPSRESYSMVAIRSLYENYFAVVGPQLWDTLPVARNTKNT